MLLYSICRKKTFLKLDEFEKDATNAKGHDNSNRVEAWQRSDLLTTSYFVWPYLSLTLEGILCLMIKLSLCVLKVYSLKVALLPFSRGLQEDK